jgi:tight adherence protein C
VKLEWMALAVTTGFLTALVAGAAMVYSAVAGRGATRRLQRRLAPSPDLPDLLRRNDRVAQLFARGLSPLARLAAPAGASGASALALKLSRGGLRAPYAVQLFLASKVLLAVLGAGAVLWFDSTQVQPLQMAPAWAVVLAAIGLFLPNGWLERRIRERQRAIEEGLPDALDLLVTCVEAGLGLDMAVQRVAREIGLSHAVLSEELTLTSLEVKAGARRADALRRLANRTGVQEVKTLVATLNQTEMFGTSVATALRVQADGLRTRRMQSAEERAAVLSVKMTFPLVLCFLPAFVVVVLGPAAVNLVEGFRSVR